MATNSIPSNVKREFILDLYLRKLLVDKGKRFTLNQDESLSNLQLGITFVYGPLSKMLTALQAEKEAFSNEILKISPNEENPLIPTQYLMDPTILLLGQAVFKCSYMKFHILTLFVIDKKKKNCSKKCSTESRRGFRENLKGHYYTIRKNIT